MVTPTRVVIGPNAETAQVNVLNQGSQAATIRVSVVNRHMTRDGRLVKATESRPGERFADSMIRFAPRRFRIPPQGGQTVRILARRGQGIEDGEYRSHLTFRVEPTSSEIKTQGDGGKGDSRVNIRLVPVYGITIPVIIREGETTATSRITDVALERGPEPSQRSIAFTLRRQGNASVYGDVRIIRLGSGSDAGIVTESRGVAVYPPLNQRRVTVPLPAGARGALKGSRIRVEYVAHGNADEVLASKTVRMR